MGAASNRQSPIYGRNSNRRKGLIMLEFNGSPAEQHEAFLQDQRKIDAAYRSGTLATWVKEKLNEYNRAIATTGTGYTTDTGDG